jgi:hypothetical protein
MKPLPAPQVPGNSEWERFDNAMQKVLSVTKPQIGKNTKPEPPKQKNR